MALWEQTPVPEVFRYFEELAAIPHPSRHVEKVGDYCEAFAREHNLTYRRDEAGNIVIWKAASSGREKDPAVILQGHLDMVPATEEGLDFDFTRDSLRLVIEGDHLTAEGTTLGADDGIAIAMCLAVLADDQLSHPALICVFTADEEIGMLGASALDMSDIKADYMINLDQEEEGVITISCAGGVTCRSVFPVKSREESGKALRIRAAGLKGGHSGAEIHLHRTNACRFLAGILKEVSDSMDISMISMTGGEADNAIPPMAKAEILLPAGKETAVMDLLKEVSDKAVKEIQNYEPEVQIGWELMDYSGPVSEPAETARLLSVIGSMPDGVQAMSQEIEGLVETSLNLGILRWTGGELTVTHSIRSSVDLSKRDIMKQISDIVTEAGGTNTFSGDYPGWPVRSESQLQNLARSVWKAQNGEKMRVEAIHAGLECGLFSHQMPEMDIISIGPTMVGIHTPKEYLSISSTERVWYFLLELLRRISG